MILRVASFVTLSYSIAATMASPTDQTILAPDSFVRPEGVLPTLTDLLTVETRGSIFYSYSRETDMSSRFDQAVGEGKGITVFVPTNKAVQALSRKPHEDPDGDVATSDAEHEAISRSNVQRWVGAHIIPSPNVDFTSTEPYDTLTSGATITFKSIASKDGGHRPIYDPHIETDATYLDSIKDSTPHIDTDAAHMASVKGSGSTGPYAPDHIDTDPAHLSSIKGSPRGSRCPGMRPRKGLALAGRVDTDAAHFASIKGPASPDHAPQATAETPIWKQYELNDGVRILAKKQASNGVMYLIDGTVLV